MEKALSYIVTPYFHKVEIPHVVPWMLGLGKFIRALAVSNY